MESRYLKQAIKAGASPSFTAPAAAAAAASSSSGSTQRSAASPVRSTTYSMHTSAAKSGADVLSTATNTAATDGDSNDEYTAALSRLPDKLLKTLYNFQLDAVKFALQRDGRVLIGDEMVRKLL
jgi:hypothetical protein